MEHPARIGKYQIQGVLGKGGMGAVYKGFDPAISRAVAIKTIAKSALDEDELQHVLARFRHEAQAVGRLVHPGIVQIYDYGEDDERAYIVMELVNGKSLHQHLLQRASYDLREVGDIIQQLLDGLGHAHAAGVVHRDVKPSNIMINSDGRIKIGDFGIAHTESSELTQHGDVIGTPHYMAPEQFLGRPIGASSDLYAVGVIAYELLTGAKLFVGTAATLMQQTLNQRPADPSSLNPRLSPLMDRVLQQALAKNPEERFHSAREFSEALRLAIASSPGAPAGDAERILSVPKSMLRVRETMNFLSRLWRGLRGERFPITPENETRIASVDPDPVLVATQDEPSMRRFVVMRQAVLSRDMAVVGYEFAQVGELASAEYELERDRALLRHVRAEDARKLVGDRIAFVSIGHTLLFDRMIDDLARTKTIPLVRATSSHRSDALQIQRISVLKQAGVSVGLADGREALDNDALAGAIGVAFFSIAAFLPPDLLRISRQLSTQHPALMLGIRGVETQEEFDACRHLNFTFFHGPFIRRREEWSQARANPSAVRVCDLLGRMRKGAELEEIAEQIKLDPMISYRILRVANSAAIGATRDITSIRDATLIVGREPLYRWLALLLCVTAPASPGHQAVLEHALARGRLMELLAAPESTVSMRQMLFLTGMFSLLDVMLKMPMDSLLSQLTLPQEVGDAIINRTGPCALALQLAEACERCDEPLVMKLCVELSVDLGRFNQTQAAAGAWARESAQGIQA